MDHSTGRWRNEHDGAKRISKGQDGAGGAGVRTRGSRDQQDQSRVQGRMPRHWVEGARRSRSAAPVARVQELRPDRRFGIVTCVQGSMHGVCVPWIPIPQYLLRNTSTTAPPIHYILSHLLAE
jgi:hypothetical protein